MFIAYHTKNFDDTAARIKKLVAVLDRDWFRNNQKEFQKLCSDGEDYYVIDYTPDNYEEYLQTLNPEERNSSNNDFTQAVFFDQFCFYPDYSSNKVSGKGVADKIIVTANDIITESGVNNDYDGFISLIADVKAWIDEEVNDNIDYYKNEEYAAVVRSIVHKIKWEIDYRFNNKLKALERKYNKDRLKDLAQVRNSKKVKIIRSYKWQGKTDELSKLYNKMKGDLILNENKLADFKHVFTNKDLTMINPVKWHDNNASELLYFIMQLSEKGLIAGTRLNYEALTGCFVTNDGKQFTASFKNLKQSIAHKLTPAKIDKIDAIVKAFA